MAALRLLACAVATRRVAYVFLVDGQLKDWRVSEKAATSPRAAAAEVRIWVEDLTPDVLVSERIDDACRKGAKSKRIIGEIARTADRAGLLGVSVCRSRVYANKYAEAEALSRRYPDVKAWMPKKRRFFDHEPRNIVLFEALSLADSILRDGPKALAAAMG